MPNRTDRQNLTLAGQLAGRLEQLGMSRRELSRRTGLSRQTIHNIEHEGNTNLKPSTFSALDTALKWEAGTALALAMGQSGTRDIETRLMEYVTRIAVHLSHMSTAELELTLVMMEENQLGTTNHTTEEFSKAVGLAVKACLDEITALREANHKHAS